VVASKQLILVDPKFQLLANYLLSASSSELMPLVHVERGVTYPEAEKITGDDTATVNKWLERLASDNILERRFVSKLIICAKCGSSDTPVQYCCPNCKSIEIDKKSLLEHLACGVIDKDDNFKQGGRLVCPRCSRELGELGISHRAVGTWFLCRGCMKPFDKPHSFHLCRKCRHFFAIDDAVLEDVWAYRLTAEAQSQIRSGSMFLKPLKDVLEDLGFQVTIADVLRGASGTEHRFDILGAKSEGGVKRTVAIDVFSSDGFVDDSSVITMFAKRYDTNPDRAILVVIPTIRESGKRLAALYKIDLLEASNALEAVEKIRHIMTLHSTPHS
jgi:hypothetical protein